MAVYVVDEVILFGIVFCKVGDLVKQLPEGEERHATIFWVVLYVL